MRELTKALCMIAWTLILTLAFASYVLDGAINPLLYISGISLIILIIWRT